METAARKRFYAASSAKTGVFWSHTTGSGREKGNTACKSGHLVFLIHGISPLTGFYGPLIEPVAP